MNGELKQYPQEVVQNNMNLFKKALNCQRCSNTQANKFGRRVDKIVPHLFGLMLNSNVCHYCGKPFKKLKQRSFDHITPFSRGGDHEIGNVVVCCRQCNKIKGNKTKVEFMGYDYGKANA